MATWGRSDIDGYRSHPLRSLRHRNIGCAAETSHPFRSLREMAGDTQEFLKTYRRQHQKSDQQSPTFAEWASFLQPGFGIGDPRRSRGVLPSSHRHPIRSSHLSSILSRVAITLSSPILAFPALASRHCIGLPVLGGWASFQRCRMTPPRQAAAGSQPREASNPGVFVSVFASW